MCLGVPGRIVDVYETAGLRMGRVDFGGVTREACLAYVPEAGVGDYTVIHVGFAISVLSEDEANATLEMLRQMDELGDEPGEMEDGAARGDGAATDRTPIAASPARTAQPPSVSDSDARS